MREARERVAEIEAKTHAFASAKGIRVQQLTPTRWPNGACSAPMLADYMDRGGGFAHRLMATTGDCVPTHAARAAPAGVGSRGIEGVNQVGGGLKRPVRP